MSPGKLIKYHRTRLGITQKELAKGICSISYLSKVENGSIQPNKEVLMLIGDKLNISLDFREVDVTEIRKQIFGWYQLIKKREFPKAKEQSQLLKKICEDSENHDIKYLYHTIYFCYDITFNDETEQTKTYERLKPMQNLFNDEVLYYFFKFESLYFFYKKDLNKALEIMKQAEKIYKRNNIIDLDVYYNLSFYYKRTYQVHKSTYYARKLLVEAQKSIDYTAMTYAYLIIASNDIRIGEYEDATNILLNLQTSEEKIRPEFKALIYHNLGYIYFQQKDYNKALTNLRQAIIYRQSNLDKVKTLYIIGLVYKAMNDVKNVKKIIEEGKKVAHKHNLMEFIHKFYVLENKVNQTTLSPEFIQRLETEIIPYFEETGEKNDLMRNLKLLGDICYELRQYKKAAESYRRTHILYTNTFRVEDYD